MVISLINKKIIACTKCRLYKTRMHAVCGEGNINAKILLIGQAPGDIENKENKIFVGPSGKVLDELLNKSGIIRNSLYLTNLLKCILPKSRKPRSDEIDACKNYLETEIEIINPEIIVPLGFHTTRFILKKHKLKIPNRHELPDLFGKLIQLENIKIFPLRHPSVVVHNPERFNELAYNYRNLKDFLI